jgi:hypothetical protein
MTLAEARRDFFRYPTPRILVPVVAAVWIARIAVGKWSIADLVIPAIILGLEPFTEWTIHVVLLHWKPRTVAGLTIDPMASRKHRAHHRDPKNIPLVFVPLRVLVTSIVVSAAAWLLLAHRLQHALIGLATSYSMLFLYEWTHYLIHTAYRPQGRVYRYVWRAHRLHHFRNENYWFGVTVHVADHVLGTFPDKDAVPVSPTARTLGVDVAA